jgi:hypothetical protein
MNSSNANVQPSATNLLSVGKLVANAQPPSPTHVASRYELSICLPDADVAFLDEFAKEHALPTRSSASRKALRIVREANLGAAYEETWAGRIQAGTQLTNAKSAVRSASLSWKPNCLQTLNNGAGAESAAAAHGDQCVASAGAL